MTNELADFAASSLTLSPDLAEVARARRFVAEIAQEAGFPEPRVFDITLVTSEATANAIEHAPVKGHIEVKTFLHRDRLEVQVLGPGRFQAPDRAKRRTPRGLGLPLMATLSDHLALYSVPEGGTLVGVTFYLPGARREVGEGPLPPSIRELIESSELVSAVTENAPVGIYVLGPDLCFRWTNRAFHQFLDEGLHSVDLAGLPYASVIPGAEDAGLIDTLLAISSQGVTNQTAEFEFNGFQRGVTYWRWEAMPLKQDRQAPPYDVLAVIWDVTEEVERRKGRERAEKALDTSRRRAGLLADTTARLFSSADPQGLVEELCRRVMKELDCDVFFNFLVDERSDRLRLNAYAGIPAEEAHAIEWLDYGIAVCGCAARDGRRIVAEDIPTVLDPRTALVRSYGVQAYACHPLMSGGQALGTLSFGTCRRTRFSDEDLLLMRSVADQVAVAMTRLRNEGQLRESKERYRRLFDSMDEGYCVLEMIFDDDGRPVDYRFLEVNSAFEEQTGLRRAVGRTIRRLVPDIEPHWFQIYGEVAKSGQPRRFTEQALGRWFDEYAFPMGDPERRQVAVLFTDVTRQKQAEEALKESERQARQQWDELQVLYGSAPVGLALLDAELRFVRINERLAEINGISAAEHVGRTVREVLPALADETERLLLPIFETGEPIVDLELVGETPAQPGVERAWLERWSPVFGADGRVVALSAVVLEVTERVMAERQRDEALERERALNEELNTAYEELQCQTEELAAQEEELRCQTEELAEAHQEVLEREERFRIVADFTYDWEHWLGVDGRFVYVSPSVARVTGYGREQFLADPGLFPEIVHPDDREQVRAHLADMAAGPTEMHFRIVRRDGAERWIEHRCQAVRGQDGRLMGRRGSNRDITERRQTQEETKRALSDLAVLARIDEILLTAPDDGLIPALLEVVKGVSASPHGVFAYVDEQGAMLAPAVSGEAWEEYLADPEATDVPCETWSADLLSRAILEKRTLVENGPRDIPEGHAAISRALAAPILYEGEVIGYFQLANRATDYREDDVALLARIARHLAPALNARLERDRHQKRLVESEERHRALAEENERLYREQLQIAQDLQSAFLHIPARLGPVRLGHLYRSATEAARVGGDFYDVFEVRDGNIAILIGDVAGHGIAAARLATLVKDVVHAFTHQTLRTANVLRRANWLLVEKGLPGFVSVFLGILDPGAGFLRYSSAGHPDVLLRRSTGEVQALGWGSPPLGVFPEATWRAGEIDVEEGDCLLLYTDGITEARHNGDFFGEGRLAAMLEEGPVSVESLPERVLERVLAFSGGSLHDDVAILALSLVEAVDEGKRRRRYRQQSLLD